MWMLITSRPTEVSVPPFTWTIWGAKEVGFEFLGRGFAMGIEGNWLVNAFEFGDVQEGSSVAGMPNQLSREAMEYTLLRRDFWGHQPSRQEVHPTSHQETLPVSMSESACQTRCSFQNELAGNHWRVCTYCWQRLLTVVHGSVSIAISIMSTLIMSTSMSIDRRRILMENIPCLGLTVLRDRGSGKKNDVRSIATG
ncbi:hypothetical protein BKA70DRAFT_42481 [Coprinopsis sp. MPI-PUGE-AT-0042]|nr:hypothetical protein BKA70DRAFT_42481 [Coprinopsis sp. MPI-PUGE-AT-0042]